MPDTTTGVVTLADAIALGLLADWVTRHRRVTWAVDGDARRLVTGTMRAFIKGADDFNFIGHTDDVRDACVWITTTWEWAMPVRQALELMGDGLMVVEQ